MNIWWFVIIPISLTWLIPMVQLRRANAPVLAFVLLALFLCVVAAFAQPLYDLGTRIGKRLGPSRLVALRERLKPKVLPPARVALLIMAIISLVSAIW